MQHVWNIKFQELFQQINKWKFSFPKNIIKIPPYNSSDNLEAPAGDFLNGTKSINETNSHYFEIQLVISCLVIISCYNTLLLSHGFWVCVIVQVQRLAQHSGFSIMSFIISLLRDDWRRSSFEMCITNIKIYFRECIQQCWNSKSNLT